MRSSRPRQRSGMGGRSSGYWRVTFGAKKLRKVVTMPLAMPTPGNAISAALSQLEDYDRDRGQEQVHERERQEHLPGHAHQLVDADAGERPAQPDGDRHEDVG